MLIILLNAYEYGNANNKIPNTESRYIIEMPTAGIVHKKYFSVFVNNFSNGGILTEFTIAPFENFNMGLSMSGTNIIGSGDIEWQKIPGISLRYRILDETLKAPALLIGFSSQGRGAYNSDDKRFETMSPGLFATTCKSYKWYPGIITFHFGLNYSFDPPSDNRALNCYFGFEQLISDVCSISMEYNANTDEYNKLYKSKKGLLNASAKYYISKDFTLELQCIDMLKHVRNANSMSRNVCIEFTKAF